MYTISAAIAGGIKAEGMVASLELKAKNVYPFIENYPGSKLVLLHNCTCIV